MQGQDTGDKQNCKAHENYLTNIICSQTSVLVDLDLEREKKNILS